MTTALEARSHLSDLELERALAGTTPLAGVAAYMVDLEEEIAAWRSVYIGAADRDGQPAGELFFPSLRLLSADQGSRARSVGPGTPARPPRAGAEPSPGIGPGGEVGPQPQSPIGRDGP